MRVIFMGTPDIAVPSLKAVAAEHEVVGVYCQPDKPVGRKQIITPPEMKVAAEKLGLPVFQPKGLKSDAVFEQLAGLSPDIIVVLAYGKLLPERVLALPKYGAINAHASLLPKYRGAAPVQYALLNGDDLTGVTVMQMDAALDTGDILIQREISISKKDDALSLFVKVGRLSADMLPEALRLIEAGELLPEKQDDAAATFAPSIEKLMGKFSFSDDAEAIVNKVRAFALWPVAFFEANGRTVKVFRARVVEENGTPGEVLSTNPLVVAAKGGAVELVDVMQSGKRRMDGHAYAAGQRLRPGDNIEKI